MICSAQVSLALTAFLAFTGYYFASTYAGPLPAPPASPQATAVYLTFTTGWCSGTVVGPHTILTGTHCVDEGSLVAINDIPAQSLGIVSDGHDHSLVTVDATFYRYATIRQRWIAQNEAIHYLGNPAMFRNLYRRGYVLGFCEVGTECLESLVDSVEGVDIDGARATLLSTRGWAGDSGAGVFDSEGYLVTTISAVTEVAPTLVPMVTFDMQFTPTQLEGIR